MPSPPIAQIVVLEHPMVQDTARLVTNDHAVRLFGITGLTGDAAIGLQHYIAANGDRLLCEPRANGEDTCRLPGGVDIAEAALANGAAQAAPDAPASYREQEAAAQGARRGVWVALPVPPVTLDHPGVRDTATIVADGRAYPLDGLRGTAGRPARELQAYIAANGDSVICQAQGSSNRSVCVLRDGTDVAMVALVNGAARVAPDAPDSYRAQQGAAMRAHRGIWSGPIHEDAAHVETVAPRVAVPYPVYQAPPPAYYPVPGLAYLGDQPTAIIGGETVFLSNGGAAGWGYWDHYHHWHTAPGHYAAHLNHYAYAHHDAYAHGYGYRPPGMHPAMAPHPYARGTGPRPPATAAFHAPTARPAPAHACAAKHC